MISPFNMPAPISMSEFSQALTAIMRQTLVVGGERSFVTRKLAVRLAKHGLYMAHHWEWKKQPGAFPENVEVVFICTDIVGHSMNDTAIAEADKRGIPVIMGTRKHALNIARLNAAGFPEIPMLSPKPLVSDKRAKQEAAAIAEKAAKAAKVAQQEANKTVVEGMHSLGMTALPGTSVTDVHPLPEPVSVPVPVPALPVEVVPMPTLPKSVKSTSSRKAPHPHAMDTLTEVQRKLLIALAASPGISNRALAEQYGLSHGQVWDGVVWARSVLGITTSEGKQKNVKVDAKIYNAACDHLGLDRVVIPASGLYEKENRRTKPDALPAGRPRKTPTYSLVNAPTAARIVATVATSEVPPEVLAAAPERLLPKVAVVKGTDEAGNTVTLHLTKPPVGEPNPSPALKAAFVPSAVDPMQDMKDAVALLRAVMVVHGVETITVTPTTTSLRRVVVVEESLD